MGARRPAGPLPGAVDLGATLDGIAAAALTSLGAERATCYAHDPATRIVSGVYTTEADPVRRAFLEQTVGMGEDRLPVCRLLLAQDDPVLIVEDIATDTRLPAKLVARLGAGALIGVRLEHRSVQHGGMPALLGTLFCSYSSPRTFDDAERNAVGGLAGLATMACVTARLQGETAVRLEENRALAAEQAALRRVATRVAAGVEPEAVFTQAAEEVAALLGVECGLVARFEPNHAVPVGSWSAGGHSIETSFPLGGAGALAQVARVGRPARISDYALLGSDPVAQVARRCGYRSAVAAPVRVAGRLWGALLAATTQERRLGQDEEARLERFAALVALAIANAESQARLAAQAASDALTGLANHGVFFERLDAEIRRARRSGQPLSLVLTDVDFFKRVNDVHGHLIGDSVLVETASRLARLARAGDTLARIGGEEFAWILPETEAREALAAAERARCAMVDTPFAHAGAVTISAGVAGFAEAMTVNDLFRAADAALYEAKAHGRNVCVTYSADLGRVGAHRAAGTSETHLAPSVERLLALARAQLGLALIAVGQVQGDRVVVRHLEGDAASFGLRIGQEGPFDGSYCQAIMEGRLPGLVRDACQELLTREPPITLQSGIGAYAGVPITLPEGEPYGVLCCLSPRPEPDLGVRDMRLLRILAGMIGEELGRDEAEQRDHRVKRDRIREVIDAGAIEIVLQPIVELAGGRVVAAEALSRFPTDPTRPPQVWFAEAAAVGLGIELELAAVRAAIARIGDVPADAKLSFNVSPATVCAPGLAEALAGVQIDRLAIELTEHARVDDFDALQAALASLRQRGSQLMIDDVGIGFSNLERILSLSPDVIKLDLSLTHDIDTDPVRRALAASLVTFARETRVSIVAEGIETPSELETLMALGVRRGQGYFLARPAAGEVPARVAVAPQTVSAPRGCWQECPRWHLL